ncbi:MAG TPA: hypothetical protein PK821_00040 [Victivallales bacterium]|nr:hypothetical protein [Victivallales bacterium]
MLSKNIPSDSEFQLALRVARDKVVSVIDGTNFPVPEATCLGVTSYCEDG